MSLSVNIIPENEQVMLTEALYHFGEAEGDGLNSVCSMERYLRFWAENKSVLHQLLGHKLIHNFDIDLNRDLNLIMEDMYRALDEHPFYRKISTFMHDYNYYPEKLIAVEVFRDGDIEPELAQAYANRMEMTSLLADHVLNFKNLATNVYDGPDMKFIVPSGRKVITFKRGMKVMRILNKIRATYYDTDRTVSEHWENFRVAHSMCLNQTRLQGTMSLSIHPLDFATMSDNDCDWDSCMSWKDYGDYRVGTVEMMNSPYVIVAYLSASDPMYYMGSEWSNKKWRQLFVVNEDMIFAIKGYPYDNPDLTDTCLRELKSLAGKNLGYKYGQDPETVLYGRATVLSDGRKIIFDLTTDMMYNDIRNFNKAFVAPHVLGDSVVHLNFSGPAVCASCGEIIQWDEASELVCEHCSTMIRCAECGDRISEDYTVWHNGVPYCEYCYSNEFKECENCGTLVHGESTYMFRLYAWERVIYNYAYKCENCSEQFLEKFKHYVQEAPYSYRTYNIHMEDVAVEDFEELMKFIMGDGEDPTWIYEAFEEYRRERERAFSSL